MEEIKLYLDDAKEQMQKSVDHTKSELAKIRAGKANPAMLNSINVDYYGAPTPLQHVATVNTPDAQSLLIRPFEKGTLEDIETAIRNSDLGLNPQNDGETIRINLPPLTEERRKDLVKQAKNEAENGKISIRNARKDANDMLKELQKDGAAEDEIKRAEDEVQKLTDTFVTKIDELLERKESEIMTI